MKLQNKLALITGAGHGIGRSIAVRLAAEGATVIVTDRSLELAEETARIIRGKQGIVEAHVLDVCRREQIQSVIGDALNRYGGIDILINTAGGGPNGPIWTYTEEQWDATINLSLKSVFLCTSAVVESMMARKFGRIINSASVVGVGGKKERTAYAAAKGGIIAMSKGWAMELAPFGITVNCISPGAIASYESVNWENGCWLGRSGTPDDIAGAAAFLASEDADFITGQNIIVDGGRTVGLRGDH